MDADLISLESKIKKLIHFCTSLRDENSALRNELKQSNQNTQILQDRMLQASNQLERLMDSMPDGQISENSLKQNTAPFNGMPQSVKSN